MHTQCIPEKLIGTGNFILIFPGFLILVFAFWKVLIESILTHDKYTC